MAAVSRLAWITQQIGGHVAWWDPVYDKSKTKWLFCVSCLFLLHNFLLLWYRKLRKSWLNVWGEVEVLTQSWRTVSCWHKHSQVNHSSASHMWGPKPPFAPNRSVNEQLIVCAKVVNHCFLFQDEGSLKLLPYMDLLSRLAKLVRTFLCIQYTHPGFKSIK